MPGILPKLEATSKGSAGGKMVASVQSETGINGDVRDLRTEIERNSSSYTNGDHEYVNGALANGVSKLPNNHTMGQLPPELVHITAGYIPLSVVIARLVQETFNSLENVIADLSEMEPLQPAPNTPANRIKQVNGITDTSQVNVQKKLRLLNFANDRRAQFIKILILSRWARQMDAVSRAVDLNIWLNDQLLAYQGAINWIGEIKRRLVTLGDPNPDIETALKVLALRKASWIPDLGYIPSQPLSPQQMLQSLHRINTLLYIRLNLHESIPPVFRDFSIASGRATFRVLGEFDVDLSIADEDPSSQLYLLDFRLTFSPTPSKLSAGWLHNEIESRANHVLKHERLQGLFDFLHNLVLTHKLTTLRNQAYELVRGRWSEQLIVEAVHRSVVVQYWLKRPGGKNWIEIGIKRGISTTTSYSNSGGKIPYIALRWFRSGKEIMDVPITMQLDHLSAEDLLKQVVFLHSKFIFQEIAARLGETRIYAAGSLRVDSRTSTSEPLHACLLMQLTTSKSIKIVQEPVSGRFAVLPASPLNSRAEFELDRLTSPEIEGSVQLGLFRSIVSQDEVGTSAHCIGWDLARSITPSQETIRRLFPPLNQRPRFYRRNGWSSGWAMAFTTSTEGDFWWIIELLDPTNTPESVLSNSRAGLILRAAYKISSADTIPLIADHSNVELAKIEEKAAGMISQFNDTRFLSNAGIRHQVQTVTSKKAANRATSLLIRLPRLDISPLIHLPTRPRDSWAREIIKLEYRGLDPSNKSTVHLASAIISKPISSIKEVVSTIPSIAYRPLPGTNDFGSFSFSILSKVGEPTIPELLSRLSTIGLLLDFVSTIKSHKLKLNTASLKHLGFTYQTGPNPLKATIHFSSQKALRIALSKADPHLRIVDYLTTSLRAKGLSSVLSLMRVTQSALEVLAAVEAAHTAGGLEVLTRSEQWHQIRYSAPYVKGSYDILLRDRRDNPKWLIPESSIKKAETGNEDFEQALKVVIRGKADGWRGVNGGIIADITGIKDLICKLDDTFRMKKHLPEEEQSNPRKRKAEGEIVEID